MNRVQHLSTNIRHHYESDSAYSSSESLRDIKRTLVEIKDVLEKLVKVIEVANGK